MAWGGGGGVSFVFLDILWEFSFIFTHEQKNP